MPQPPTSSSPPAFAGVFAPAPRPQTPPQQEPHFRISDFEFRASLRAFTLIELLMVLAVIAIAVAILIPSLAGFGRNRVTVDTADHFVAATHFARSKAIIDGAVCRINIDLAGGRWWITKDDGSGTNFVLVDTLDGRAYTVAEGIRMEFEAAASAIPPTSAILPTAATPPSANGTPASDDAQIIEFQANGRTDPAIVRFYNRTGPSIEVLCETPLDVYHLSTSRTGGQK